ncbi:group 3 secretory phospholipase A2-like [Morone saxatilis]|uniref:group 3 secretory phospholipase A2-like n=1 Tax=Morone saxatilis TaxID=34816 RepID=UPI0015E1F7BB|nr:group 3 secretory phospholipase A2-like [Morone saxatilis]
MRPVTCEVNTDPLVTERYLGLCGRSGTQGGEIPQRFNISMLLAPDAPCALVSSSAPELTRRRRSDGTEAKSRRKRSWIFPGTLWCGTGSKAVGYDQLGMFESTDRCCREHDHCLHVIPAFTRNYGVFNSKFFTVSHCDCDQRFRQCLLGANDTIASMVGYSFFSILQVPCFELEEQRRCTEMYWWGMCKVANKAPYAVFKSPLPFNTTDVTSQSGHNANSNLKSSAGQRVTESPVMSTESPKHEHGCSYKDSPRDSLPLCGSLKHLDGCKYKIPPLEKKYDLQNMESKTAYHCDCTSRLAVQIESFKQPSTLPMVLMDFVSQYCFRLPEERNCHSRKSCSRGFSKASDLLRALKKIEEKDTAGVRNSVNDRKRGIPVRLYKRCLRLERGADIMAQLTRL